MLFLWCYISCYWSYYSPFLLHSVPLKFQYFTSVLQFISQTDKDWKPRELSLIKIDCTTCMARDLHFSLLQSTQTGCGAYLYYPVLAGIFFVMGKAGGTGSWPFTFTYCWVTQSHFRQFLRVGWSEQSQYKGWTLSVDCSNCDSTLTHAWNFSGYWEFMASQGSFMHPTYR